MTARESPVRLSRLGLLILAGGVALLLLAQAGIIERLESEDVFGAAWSPTRAEAYGLLSGSVDPLVIKYGYALRHPRFRYGLFGSSRGMGISHNHLGLPEGEFFNFSTGSTGFRQSVALLRALQEVGKIPDTVILTLDNHDIRYFRQVEWPNALVDPLDHLVYLRDELASGAGLVVTAYTAAEAVAVAVHDIVTKFNIARLSAIINFYRGPTHIFPNYFRKDGSRGMDDLGIVDPPFVTYSKIWPSMAAGMKADLLWLGRLAASGTRVIVFETPISPRLAADVETRRDAITVNLRKTFQAECLANGLTCLPAPPPLDSDRDLLWESCCHAPPVILGRYLQAYL